VWWAVVAAGGWAATAAWALEPLNTQSMDDQATYRVGVIQVADIEPYQQSFDGFQKALADNGLVRNRNLNVERIKIDFDLENAGFWDRFVTLLRIREAANHFVQAKADLVLTIGTPATKYAKTILEDAHIPVVFTAVANPVDAGCPSLTDGGPGVTGSTLYIDMNTSMKIMHTLFPAVQRIGMVHTEDENGVAHVQAAAAAAKPLGITVSEAQVHKNDNIIPALKSLLEPGRDAQMFAVPLDTYYGLRHYEPAKDLGDFGTENNIPVVSFALVRVPGAVVYVGADFGLVGQYAGTQAAKILKRHVKPDILPVVRQSQPTVLIDPQRAAAINLQLPADMAERKQNSANGFWQISLAR
jgi:putative ABC transport system substrate-binding protein